MPGKPLINWLSGFLFLERLKTDSKNDSSRIQTVIALEICSVLYSGVVRSRYQVEESRGYVYGTIPLIMDGTCMIVFLITCAVCG